MDITAGPLCADELFGEENVNTVRSATGYAFNNLKLLSDALTAAHRDRYTDDHSHGNRDLAQLGMLTLKNSIRDRRNRTNKVYERFLRKDDLLHVARESGIEMCIKSSPRQPQPVPRVVICAMRALIAAIHEDCGGSADVVFSVMDQLQRFLPPPPQTSRATSAEGNASDDISVVLTQSPRTTISPTLSFMSSASNSTDRMSTGNGAVQHSWIDVTDASSIQSSHACELQSAGDSISTLPHEFPAPPMNSVVLNNAYMPQEQMYNIDTSMWDVPESERQSDDQPQDQPQTQMQPNRVEKLRKSKAMTELEKYISHQLDAGSRFRTSQDQKILLRPFNDVFASLKRQLRSNNSIMWKFYLAITSPHTVVAIKKGLESLDRSQASAPTGCQDIGSKFQEHYHMIKENVAKSAVSVIQLRYHLYEFYTSKVDEDLKQRNSGYIHKTPNSYRGTSSRGASGNPINRAKAESVERFVHALEPKFENKSTDEQARLKRQILTWLRHGQRLSELVESVKSIGILCLLPFPADGGAEQTCISASVDDITKLDENQMKCLVRALRGGPDIIQKFCVAAKFVLGAVVWNWEAVLRMSRTEYSNIEGMIHGSMDLLSQFDLMSIPEPPMSQTEYSNIEGMIHGPVDQLPQFDWMLFQNFDHSANGFDDGQVTYGSKTYTGLFRFQNV